MLSCCHLLVIIFVSRLAPQFFTMLFSVYHIFIKICIDSHLLERNKSKKQKNFLVVRSPVALAVSWLKIEPRSRFFPVMETIPGFHYFHYKKNFCFLLLYVLSVFSVTVYLERNKHNRNPRINFSRSSSNRNWVTRFYYRKI